MKPCMVAPSPDALPSALKISVQDVRDFLINTYELESVDAEKILVTYAESLREILQKLQQAVKDKDGVEAAGQTHALKGACLNIGQARIADAVYLLEKELAVTIEAGHLPLVGQLITCLQPITDMGIYAATDDRHDL